MNETQLGWIKRFAAMAVTSGFVKRFRSVDECFCAIIAGAECGLSAMQSMQHICVINGVPNIQVKMKMAMVALRGFGPVKKWIEGWEYFGKQDSKVIAHATVERDGQKFERTFDLETAKKAGLMSKDNWKNYPQDMLMHRAVERVLDDVFPDIVVGFGEDEDIYGHPEPEQPIMSGGSKLTDILDASMEAAHAEPKVTAPQRLPMDSVPDTIAPPNEQDNPDPFSDF